VKVSKDTENLMYHGALGCCCCCCCRCSASMYEKSWFSDSCGVARHGKHDVKQERKVPTIRAATRAPVAPMAAAFALEVYPGAWALFKIAFPITLDDEGVNIYIRPTEKERRTWLPRHFQR
jgi:hypothetical protein